MLFLKVMKPVFLSDLGWNITRTCSSQVSWDPNNVEHHHKPFAHVEMGKTQHRTFESNQKQITKETNLNCAEALTKTKPCWRSDGEPHCIAVKYCLQYWLHFWVLEVRVNTETESIDLNLAAYILQLCSDVARQTLKKHQVYY